MGSGCNRDGRFRCAGFHSDGHAMSIPPRLTLFIDTLGMHPAFQLWTRPSDLDYEPPF
jgi:hypothetical protein